jgi:hypothetical protein
MLGGATFRAAPCTRPSPSLPEGPPLPTTRAVLVHVPRPNNGLCAKTGDRYQTSGREYNHFRCRSDQDGDRVPTGAADQGPGVFQSPIPSADLNQSMINYWSIVHDRVGFCQSIS